MTTEKRTAVRVLLVDDHLEFLNAASTFLSTEPHIEVVGRAQSGSEAIRQVSQLHPDLVLMDLAMPEMSGLDATQYIKKQPHAPRVIIVTLRDAMEYRKVAKIAGADGFVSKEEFSTHLLPLVHQLWTDLGDSVPAPE